MEDAHPIARPGDLDVVRDSYDRVADRYVEMVTTTGMGDIRTQPWMKAAVDVFADAVAGRGPVLDLERTEAYGGVPVRWTTHRWRPEQLAALVEQAGLTLEADLRLPGAGPVGPGVVLVAQAPPGAAAS